MKLWWNRLLTIPFFVGFFLMPMGLLLLMEGSVLVDYLAEYGNWSLKEWHLREE